MLMVMGVLPQILLLGDSVVEKTRFSINRSTQLHSLSGTMRVNGHLRGYVNGFVDADIRGIVNGTVRASVDISKLEMVPEQPSGENDSLAEDRKESIPESAGEGDSNET